MPQAPIALVDGTEVSKDFLEPLGYLTIWFSLLEAELDLAIWRMLDLDLSDSRGRIVTVQLTSFKTKTTFLEALVHERIIDIPAVLRISAAIEGARKVNTRRNSPIHGEWLANRLVPDLASKVSANTRRGRLQQVPESFSPDAVMRIAESAVDAAHEIATSVTQALRVP